MEDLFDFTNLQISPDRNPGLVAHRSRIKNPAPKLGRAFLDATTPITEFKPAPPDVKLQDPPITVEMRGHLDEVEWALNRFEEQLVKNNGLLDDETFLTLNIKGLSLPEYLKVIRKDLVNYTEYEYVMSLVHKMVDRIDQIHNALLAGQSLESIPEPPYEPPLVKYTRRKRK